MSLIRILTAAALFSLLFTTGLRLTLGEIHGAVPLGRRFLRLAVLQFGVVPILTVGAARFFRVPAEVSMSMLLLGAAPFAVVVPVFTRMARGDLALGAGLTAVFPVLSSVLTPMVCWVAAPFLPSVGPLRFALVPMMVTLLATAPLPLVLGLGALNRNMALALLVAAGSFPGSRIVAGVASLGLLLITLGLVHVGIWRWIHRAGTPAPDGRP